MPPSWEELVDSGLEQLEADAPQRAEPLLKQAIEAAGSSSSARKLGYAHFYLAQAYRAQRRHQLSLEHLDRAAETWAAGGCHQECESVESVRAEASRLLEKEGPGQARPVPRPVSTRPPQSAQAPFVQRMAEFQPFWNERWFGRLKFLSVLLGGAAMILFLYLYSADCARNDAYREYWRQVGRLKFYASPSSFDLFFARLSRARTLDPFSLELRYYELSAELTIARQEDLQGRPGPAGQHVARAEQVLAGLESRAPERPETRYLSAMVAAVKGEPEVALSRLDLAEGRTESYYADQDRLRAVWESRVKRGRNHLKRDRLDATDLAPGPKPVFIGIP